MKKQLLYQFISFLIFSLYSIAAFNQSEALTREQINSQILKTMYETNKVFYWSSIDDHFLWSALVQSDSIASIGIVPSSVANFNAESFKINVSTVEWNELRNQITGTYLSFIKEKYGALYDEAYLFPYGKYSDRPYLNLRLFDLELLILLRQIEGVRYIEPLGYSLDDKGNKSTQGCANYMSNINSADYISISPTSRQSWTQLEANVDCAWNKSNHGTGIWIAVMDTGVSPNQQKLNGEFTEGESANRMIEKQGFYRPNGGATDGWQDQCGHGTAMTGLAVAPRGYNDTPAGIAYKSSCVSYRVTEDVVINTSNEKTGLADGLYHAANDSRIKIISISLGDVLYNSQVGDAVIFSSNAGKLIFAAAGTSTFITNWFGVIFPATMNETIAVTGVKESSPRYICDACHDGSEVDFVAVMERTNNYSRHAVSLAQGNHEQGYVGGSSCATATYAGIAALVWGNNPSWNKGQVLNRMIQTSDYYPNRDSNYGWGLIDACTAVDSSFSLPCNSNFSNSVDMEITNISFPPTFDGLTSTAEWVLSFNGVKHFFNVPISGASGNPASFIDLDVCGNIPININLGMTACGINNINLVVESFEDDGFTDDCDYDNGDDDYALTNENVGFNNPNITHTSPAGNFVISYSLSCNPTATPSASISQDTIVCTTDPDLELVVFASGGTAPYTVNYKIDNGPLLTLTGNNVYYLLQSTTVQGTHIYDLVDITDANGCFQMLNSSATVTINSGILATLVDNSPVTQNTAVTFTAGPIGMDDYEFFHDMNKNDTLDMGESLQTGPSNVYANNSLSDEDRIGVIVIHRNNCLDTAYTEVQICPIDYMDGGNGRLMGTVIDSMDFETDGVIDSDQLISNSAVVDYDSGTEIHLLNGFEVQLGAEILMFIDGCDGNGGLIQLRKDSIKSDN